MTHVRRLVIVLVLDLTLFFNLERLSFGEQYYHFINIQGFVYGIAVLATISIIFIPPFRHWGIWPLLTLWLGAYAIGKIFLFKSPNHPAIGEFNTFVTIAEGSLLALLIVIAHALARALDDFDQAVEKITLAAITHRLRPVDAAAEDIQTELVRSRRHHEPLSVIVVEPEKDSVQAALNHAVEEVQRAMMTRYVSASMAAVISKVLRRTDMVLEQREKGRFIVFSPETDTKSSRALINHIQTRIADELHVTVQCGVAEFPGDALTFEELVHKAEENLLDGDGVLLLPRYSAVTSRDGS